MSFRYGYDIVSTFASTVFVAFAAGLVCAAPLDTPTRLILLGIFALIGGGVTYRAVKNLHARVDNAIARAAKTLDEPVADFVTIGGGFEELQRLQSLAEQRWGEQVASHEQIERHLKASASLLQTAYAALTDAVLVVDTSGRLVLVNPAAEPILGLGEEHLNRPLVEVLRVPQLLDFLSEAAASQTSQSGPVDLTRTSKTAMVVASPLPSPPGGTVLVVHDETELRKLERMRSDFVSNVSHELKTPLTSIQAYADTLRDGGLEDPDMAEMFLGRIIEQAERLGELIVDMLDLARLETTEDNAPVEPLNIAGVTQRCLSDHAPVAEAAGVSLSVDIPDEAVVLVDESNLRAIFDNLVKNAIEHTPADGDVAVTLDANCPTSDGTQSPGKHGFVCLHVQDTGAGIPRELQERVFERFFRVDKSRNRQIGGSGLGLAIVKHAAERFGGSVSVESKLGQGSVFHVVLPGSLTSETSASVLRSDSKIANFSS